MYANGRCPEEEEHPPGAPFGGDPDSGPAAPRGDYTPVGPESEDVCSDRAYALRNPTICGGRGPYDMSADSQYRKNYDLRMKRSGCEARGGQWKTDPGVCVGSNSQPSQKKCPDGRTYPRDHKGGVCPRVRRRSRSGPEANIPEGPGFDQNPGGWGQ